MKLTGQKKAAFLLRMAKGRKAAAARKPKLRKGSIRKSKKTIGKASKTMAAEWAKDKRTRARTKKAARGLRNPDDMAEASAMFEEFHGRPPNFILEYDHQEEYRAEVAELGKLIELRFIAPGDEDDEQPLRNFGPCQVTCTGDGKNIYFIGGNMAVDIEALGIEESKDYVELGECSYIMYHTVKGFHDFDPTKYWHRFGEEDGHRPVLLYDSLNQALFIAGGAYRVKPEGIVN